MARPLMLVAGCLAVALSVAIVPAMAAPGASAGRSGITGRALTIVCPGTPATGQSCSRRPVRATIQVLRLPSKRRVATLHSTGTGSFGVDLTPGTYQLTATATSAGFVAAPVRTTVHAHKFARATIMFFAHHPPVAASGVG